MSPRAKAAVDRVRRTTTFLLALFLWLHALFLLTVQPALISKLAGLLRLAPSEAILLALLVLFSLLAASGFWKTVGSIIYIYCFPLVLLGYVFKWGFWLIRAVNRWLMSQAATSITMRPIVVVPQKLSAPTEVSGSGADRTPVGEAARFWLRPFRRFMFLWCILLLVTTHVTIVWLCLIVVVAQLARQVFLIVKLLVLSSRFKESLRRVGAALLTPIHNALAALESVTRDSSPTNELRNLLNQLNIWRTVLDFLRDPYLLSRWAWIICAVFLGVVYLYISTLFSFAYYGIARISGIVYSWPDAFITSLFFPFFFRDLPRILGVKLLSGIQCVLLLGVGIGTIANFMGRRLDEIRKAVTEASDRFGEQSVQEKYIILQEKFSGTTHSSVEVVKAISTTE